MTDDEIFERLRKNCQCPLACLMDRPKWPDPSEAANVLGIDENAACHIAAAWDNYDYEIAIDWVNRCGLRKKLEEKLKSS